VALAHAATIFGLRNGDTACSAIKPYRSAASGCRPRAYLPVGAAFEIKVGQGAKPGEGASFRRR